MNVNFQNALKQYSEFKQQYVNSPVEAHSGMMQRQIFILMVQVEELCAAVDRLEGLIEGKLK